jgi:adenylate cyclase
MIVADVERRLATLVSADAAGYSRLMASDELATIRAITAYRAAGHRIAAAHDGRVVDSPGDNLLFEFADSAAAVDAAMAFQSFVVETNADIAPAERMQFRIGIHTGEVVVEGDRIYGSGINIAARLERLARPGGICISDEVRRQLPSEPALEDVGLHQVKNIPAPVHAYFVDVPGQTIPAEQRHGAAWPAIAVMPFDTGDEDSDAEYLAEGLCEDLITDLAMWRQFPVIARRSTYTYKGQAIDPVRVGQDLNAAYVVTGSVRRLGQRVRITAQLVETQDGQHVWADRWNTSIEDLFETATELAGAISVALRPELLRAMADRAMRQAPADLTAWDYALRGVFYLRRITRDNAEMAITLLSRAVAMDAGSGFAHAQLAYSHYRLVQNHWSSRPDEDLKALVVHAEAAVACDPMDANAHLYRSLACSVQGKREEAIASLRRAVELNPSLPVAHSLLGQFLGLAESIDEGIREIDQAIALSPRDPQLWTFYAGKAIVYFNAGRYADSQAASERLLELDPGSPYAYSNIASTAALLGDIATAKRALAKTLEVWPDMSEATLRTLFSSIPQHAVEKYFEGLRLAGYQGSSTST